MKMKKLCTKCSKELVFVGANARTGAETFCCEVCDWGIARCSVGLPDDRAMSAELPRPMSEEQRAVNRALNISDEEFSKHKNLSK
jgi:hypothetical protein